MELLYHVTKEDSVLGSVERSTAHRDQILHRAGMIFVIRSDGRILLQHRSPSKTIFPDCWDSSSSFHVTFGETYEQAARRELKEETGISAQLTISHPRTRSSQYSPAKVMILSRLIHQNPLARHSTQKTKLMRLLHPRRQRHGLQEAGIY